MCILRCYLDLAVHIQSVFISVALQNTWWNIAVTSLAMIQPTYTVFQLLSRHFSAGINDFIHSLKLYFLPHSSDVCRSWKAAIIASLYLSATTELPYMGCIGLIMIYWRIKWLSPSRKRERETSTRDQLLWLGCEIIMIVLRLVIDYHLRCKWRCQIGQTIKAHFYVTWIFISNWLSSTGKTCHRTENLLAVQ